MRPETAQILVVEDDPVGRQLLQRALQDEGWSVLTAEDGEQGLARSRATRPALVVLDWNLPGVSGAGLAAGLRERCGDWLPILLLSAEEGLAGKGREVGACATVAKPFDLEELLLTVRRLIGDAAHGARAPKAGADRPHAVLREQLSEYLEDTLPPSARARVERHLARCAACGAFARTLRRTIELVHHLPPPRMPAAARVRLQHLIGEKATPSRR
jgi:DNA-binding response OmpR family regulator